MGYDNLSPAQGHQALSDIDIIRNNCNELRKFEASLSTSPPSNPVGGQFWWTTDTTSLYQRNQANTAWIYLWSEADLPANESGVTAHINNNITASVAVHGIKQGSGNGFDADKLDGLEASAFLAGSHAAVTSGIHGSGSSILLHLPSNVPILIIASTAPTGWTQVTSYNDKVIRIVSGAGGGQGGSWTISGLATEAAHTHPTPIHSHWLALKGSTLQSVMSDEMVGDSEAAGVWRGLGNQTTGGPGDWFRPRYGYTETSGNGTTGASSAHNHASDASWRPLYLDVIAVTKNA